MINENKPHINLTLNINSIKINKWIIVFVVDLITIKAELRVMRIG